MKRLTIFFAAVLMLAVSCSKTGVEQEGTLATLYFSLALPGAETKTLSDGMQVDKVVCAVFEDGKEIAGLRQTIAVNKGQVAANYKPSLYIGRSYQLVFWAQHGDYYVTDDLTNIKPSQIACNTDYADAFHASVLVDFSEDGQTGSATLVRPLSKLNVAVPADVWNEDAEYVRVTMEVSEAFDAVTGLCSKTVKEVSFAAPVSEETITVGGEEHNVLAYNYLFPGDNTSVRVEVSKDPDGDFSEENVIIDITTDNVPVAGNTQTHMVGDIFRGDLEFSVSVSAGFTNDDETVEM